MSTSWSTGACSFNATHVVFLGFAVVFFFASPSLLSCVLRKVQTTPILMEGCVGWDCVKTLIRTQKIEIHSYLKAKGKVQSSRPLHPSFDTCADIYLSLNRYTEELLAKNKTLSLDSTTRCTWLQWSQLFCNSHQTRWGSSFYISIILLLAECCGFCSSSLGMASALLRGISKSKNKLCDITNTVSERPVQ